MDNLKLAFDFAIKGKRNRGEIKPIIDNKEYYLNKLINAS